MHALPVVYVTVGTTKFEALVAAIASTSVLGELQKRKCKKIILQHGNSTPLESPETIYKNYGIEVVQYQFRPNIEDIRAADLVIGHAGAGTCMDVLNNGKAGLIVINDDLMDNHQLELAQQLALEEFIFYCKVNEVPSKLSTLDFNVLKPYEPGTANMQSFVNALNELMSFS